MVNRRGRRDVGFAIVGPGDVREELLDDVRRRGLGETIHLPGQVDSGLLRDYIATSDVCVSVDPRNDLNDRSVMIKVLEYMIMGRAVVQFPLREMQRLCGDATVYARDGDPLDLADKIAGLLDDPALREEMGRRAAERIGQGLTWPHEVPVLLGAVEQATAGRPVLPRRRR